MTQSGRRELHVCRPQGSRRAQTIVWPSKALTLAAHFDDDLFDLAGELERRFVVKGHGGGAPAGSVRRTKISLKLKCPPCGRRTRQTTRVSALEFRRTPRQRRLEHSSACNHRELTLPPIAISLILP